MLLFSLSQLYDSVNHFAISWVIIIIVFGNLKRLSRDNYVTYFIRMTLYFAVYILPLIMDYDVTLPSSTSVTRIAWGCVIAIVYNLIRLMVINKKVRMMLSKEFIIDTYKDTIFTLIMRIYNLIGAAICEELLFRGYVLSMDLPLIVSVFISSVYFVLSHYLLPWGNVFVKNDFINQFVFGFVSALLFLKVESIIPCVLLHLLYNLLEVLRFVKIIDRHYIRPDRYQDNNEGKLWEGKEL